jgi:uncharacterized protein YjbI with pentapeptide repeats
MFSTVVIAVAGVLLLIATVIPGVRLYWPQHRDPIRRSDLGIALMTGALIAFAVLAVQVMIQIRSQRDANAREAQADRAALLLQLGRSANLAGLDLHEEDLSSAYMNAKNLRSANFKQAAMSKASLQDSKLIGADLRGATLDEARFDRADLRYADFGGASLVGAQLNSANLDAAVLTPGVDLSDADLSNASARADFRLAVLTKASLVGTRLAPANLQRVDFTGADLEFADLRGANLMGANLLHAKNLNNAKDLSHVRYDAATQWPSTFTWRDETPQCKKTVCVLRRKKEDVNDFPPELKAMRKRLARATAAQRCLPGWLVEDRPLAIQAYSPGHRASFNISTAESEGRSAKAWASSFGHEKVKPIRAITADGDARRPAYAVRFLGEKQLEEVHVWFVRGGRGFQMWASASADLFSLFERDFIRLFGAVGVEGDLFPRLRGGKDTCST